MNDRQSGAQEPEPLRDQGASFQLARASGSDSDELPELCRIVSVRAFRKVQSNRNCSASHLGLESVLLLARKLRRGAVREFNQDQTFRPDSEISIASHPLPHHLDYPTTILETVASTYTYTDHALPELPLWKTGYYPPPCA